MTATDKLRELLNERGVKWDTFSVSNTEYIHWTNSDGHWCAASIGGPQSLHVNILSATPNQAIDATLGREQLIDPAWEEWRDGLRHAEIKTIGDAVQQLMYETIEHGGNMGPNGNTCGGVDEGEVLTLGFINSWIAKFEALLGNDGPERTNNGVTERGTCHIIERHGDWYCDACGNEVGSSDPTSELFIDGNAIELWEFCPRCGKKRVHE